MDQYPNLQDTEKLFFTKDIESAIYNISDVTEIKRGVANERMDKLIILPNADLRQKQQDSPLLKLSNATERLETIQKGLLQLTKEHLQCIKDIENAIKRRIIVWSKKQPYYQTAKNHSIENNLVLTPKTTIPVVPKTPLINKDHKLIVAKKHQEPDSLWPQPLSNPYQPSKPPVIF